MSGQLPRFLPVQLLGVTVHAVDLVGLIAWLRAATQSNSVRVLASHNLHSVALHHSNTHMRAFDETADLMVTDGRPLIVWARLLGLPLRARHKLSWLDHLDALLATAVAEGWTVAHLGCRPEVGERAADVLRRKHPGLRLETQHGYFNFPGPANDAALAWLHALKPRLLLVGMGMPRQERWLLSHRHVLPPCVAVTCGATFDYFAGALPTPPRWLSPLGLEWCFRLITEPRRLAHRYLVEPFSLVPWLVRDWRIRTRATSRNDSQRAVTHLTSVQPTVSSLSARKFRKA